MAAGCGPRRRWSCAGEPGERMPGNKMALADLPDEQDRLDVIAYLKIFSRSEPECALAVIPPCGARGYGLRAIP